jgi:hypothetical protein
MSQQSRLQSLITSLGTDYKTFRTWLTGTSAGAFSLTTTSQNVAGAINELNAKTVTVPDASESVKGVVELATLAEMAIGTDTTRAATVAGVRQERTALKAEILGGASAAHDTLSELVTLINSAEETSVIDALTTTVGLKANSADVYTKVELGDPETDLVALYTAAKA